MRDEDAICRNLKVKQGLFFQAAAKRGYTIAGMAAAAEIAEPTLRSYNPTPGREASTMGLWAMIKLARAKIPADLLSILIEDSDLSLTAIDPAAADWMRLAARTANFASKACAFQASDNHIDHREAAELREDMLIIISEGPRRGHRRSLRENTMTTTVTVKTHDWPARVSSWPCADGQPVDGAEWTELGKVDPNSSREFVVHSHADIIVQELPLPKAD